MSGRPVLLNQDEAQELERMIFECDASPTAVRQYLAELIVHRTLFDACRKHSWPRIEGALRRLLRPSLAAYLPPEPAGEPPQLGSKRLI